MASSMLLQLNGIFQYEVLQNLIKKLFSQVTWLTNHSEKDELKEEINSRIIKHGGWKREWLLQTIF